MFTEQTTLCPAHADDAMYGITANHITPPPFTAPLKSRATRKFSWKSRERCSGTVVININGTMITLHFESKLELMVIMFLLGRGDVVEIWDQPPQVSYLKADGNLGKHTFDFRVVLNDSSVIAIAVKPKAKAARAAFQADIARVTQATPKSFADHVVVMSEADFTRAQVINATRYFEFSKDSDLEADAVVREVIKNLNGATSIAEIVGQTGLAGRAYRAIVRAIFANEISPAADSVISTKTIVHPTHAGGRC